MEHIIFHNILSHLNANNILIDNQHDFRAGHSCATQLITLTEDILHALDQRKQVNIRFCKSFRYHTPLAFTYEITILWH